MQLCELILQLMLMSFEDLMAYLKKDKEEMEKQREDDKELNRVMSHTGSVDAGEQQAGITTMTTTTTSVGLTNPSEPAVVHGATAAAAANVSHSSS